MHPYTEKPVYHVPFYPGTRYETRRKKKRIIPFSSGFPIVAGYPLPYYTPFACPYYTIQYPTPDLCYTKILRRMDNESAKDCNSSKKKKQRQNCVSRVACFLGHGTHKLLHGLRSGLPPLSLSLSLSFCPSLSLALAENKVRQQWSSIPCGSRKKYSWKTYSSVQSITPVYNLWIREMFIAPLQSNVTTTCTHLI
jgi:hypothetical protein